MSRTRAYRRHKLQVKKAKVSRYWVAGCSSYLDINVQTDKRIVGKVAASPKACACWMCNNHRKVFGETFGDIRRKQLYVDQE